MGKTHRNSLKSGHKVHWYEIKKILGQGGFGITYLAYDPNLDKNVAIKEYLPIEIAVREGDCSVHPVTEDRSNQYKWGLDRFISEARTLSKFDHPNVVRVLSVTEENNTAYMVMAYEEGQSLQDKLKGRKTLEEAELLKILIPILGGLEIVHKAGFIHRDIKPDNIFIRNDGSPVLLDFGSARQALGEETKTLTSLVSPGYAPFEQYFSKGDKQGAWTDIYGLGATLYRAIAGIAPQDAVDRSNAIINNSQDTNVSAIDVGEGRYSERFLKAIDHAIKFKSEERPQTINEWKSEFQLPDDPIKEAEEIEQTTTQPGETALARQHKNRLTPVMMVFILAALVSLFAAIYFEKEVSQFFQSINIVSNWQKEKDAELSRQQQEKENQRLLAMEQQRLEQEEALKIAEDKKRLDEEALSKQQHIAELFIKAEEAISDDRLVEPVGNNAFDIYMQLSDLSPNNKAVAEGKKTIFKALLRKAEDFMKIDLFEMANRMLDQADAIEPDSPEVRLVKVRLKAVQQIALEEKQRLEEEKKQREIELDKKKLEEEKRISELEKKRLEDEKRLADAARLAEQERQQQAEAEKLQKEQEKRKQFSQLIAKADLALSNRDKDQAIKRYNEALLLYPDDVNANLGLKNAENLKHKLCYDVLGLWVWDKAFGQDTIILKENGTIDYQTSIKGSGSWECTNPESRTIKIQLSAAGFSNEWLSEYSADGSCLQGPETWGDRGCYRRSESDQKAVKAAPREQTKTTGTIAGGFCNKLVGTWKQPTWGGDTVIFNKNGIVSFKSAVVSYENKWTCLPEKNEIAMDILNNVDNAKIYSFNLSDDGRALHFRDGGQLYLEKTQGISTESKQETGNACKQFVGTWEVDEFIGSLLIRIMEDGTFYHGTGNGAATTWECLPEKNQIVEGKLGWTYTLSENGTCLLFEHRKSCLRKTGSTQ